MIGFRILNATFKLEGFDKIPLLCFFIGTIIFVVLSKNTAKKFFISNPAIGLLTYSKKNFLKGWITGKEDINNTAIQLDTAIALLDESITLKDNKIDFNL